MSNTKTPTPTATSTAATNQNYPYECDVNISFPTAMHAENTMRVLQVDQEVGDRVRKSFAIVPNSPNILLIHFQATEARLLRVSVSSFCDYLTVALKCYQEFDDTLMACPQDDSSNKQA